VAGGASQSKSQGVFGVNELKKPILFEFSKIIVRSTGVNGSVYDYIEFPQKQ